MTDFEIKPGETHAGMPYQTRVRYEGANERFVYVAGEKPQMKSGKGKYYLLNHKGLKEAYEAALEQCPIAADAILVLMWDAAVNYQTLNYLAKDADPPADHVNQIPSSDLKGE